MDVKVPKGDDEVPISIPLPLRSTILQFSKGEANANVSLQPSNAPLAALLASIKPAHATGETKVFPSPKGTWIDVHNLTNRGWRAVVSKLEGTIAS